MPDISSPSRYKVWFVSTRPHSLPLSASTVLLGAGVAARAGHTNFGVVFLCLCTAVFLQILSNFANDYGDIQSGVDLGERLGPKRMAHLGYINLTELRLALFVSGLLALVSGVGAISLSRMDDWVLYVLFALLGLCSLLAAIGYTMGKKPYGYYGLGDAAVFIFFGLVPVIGTAVLCGAPFWLAFLPSIGAGLGGVAVLNINNIRDIDNDSLYNKRTFAVRLGRAKALYYHVALVTGCVAAFALYVGPLNPYLFLFSSLFSLPLFWSTFKVLRHESAEDLNRELVRTFLAVSLLSSVVGLGLFVI